MAGRKIIILAAFLLASFWLVVGCADGVLLQESHSNGRVERLRIDGAEGWSDYDTTPRYHSKKFKDQDGYGIVLKNETTF